MGVLKGLIGVEDLSFGLGSFPRMEGFGSRGVRKQICAEDFPILDYLGQYDAAEVETALREAYADAVTLLYAAADALYDGDYITSKEDFINEILDKAANAAGGVNKETDEDYEGGEEPTVPSLPIDVGVVYIMYPAMMKPGERAMLWVEGVGRVAPYTWSFVANNSGGSLTAQADTSRVLYEAGAVQATDTIKVEDANGLTATCQIVVSNTAPDVTIYGPTTAVVDGPDISLEAVGGASPYAWEISVNVTGSSLTFSSYGSFGSASYTPGSIVGKDTVKVTEHGGSIDLHDITVQTESLTDTSPQIHGASSCDARGATDPVPPAIGDTLPRYAVRLQVIGGDSPVAWEVSDNQSGGVLYGLERSPLTGEVSQKTTPPASWHTEVEYVAGTIAGVTDTIRVTDNDGDQDTHTIAVLTPVEPTLPVIYGYTNCPIRGEILLKVYGGLGPYIWEVFTNNSGSELSEYENDEDGYNRFRAGGVSAVIDTVRVTDANGNVDEHSVSVYDPAGPTPTPEPTVPFDWPAWWNDEYGFLVANIAPQGAIDASAKWRAKAGSWNDSGIELEGFLIGENVTVDFKDVDGWTTPDSEEVTIPAGPDPAVVSGVYNQTPDAVSYFSVSIAQASYYIGKRMKVTVVPRDASANPVNLGNTSVTVSVDAGHIDARTATTGFVRSAAACSKVVTIVGASDDIYFVWWPDGAVPANITITVALTADATTNGADSVPVDAAANVNASLVVGGTYTPSTIFSDFKVQVEDGDAARCEYFEGDIRLTPDVGTISLDGVTYAGFVTLSIGPTHANRPNIYITGPGTVTITARIDEHVAKTDTQAIDETAITFSFGSLWTPTTDRGLMNDNVAFTVEITAYQGGLRATTYDLACHLFADIGAIAGDVINIGDWTDGRVTVAPTVDWVGSQPVITLTCTDDVTPANTGNRAFVTEDQALQHSEVCALAQSMRYGSWTDVVAATAFAAAKADFSAAPTYDPDNYSTGSPSDAAIDCRTVGKAEGWNHATFGYNCKLGYGISLYYVAATNFDDSHHLFAEITFDNPAWQNSIWAKTDLIIGVTPVNYDVSTYGLENKWAYVTGAYVLHTVAAADILNAGVVLIDLARIKSDILAGIPIQVQLRPNISTAIGGYVSDTNKYSRIRISSVSILGY